jgi:hypothetical protein
MQAEEKLENLNAIGTLTERLPYDQVQVQRLKKRKLWLRDVISRLEADRQPDLIA